LESSRRSKYRQRRREIILCAWRVCE
jgi:hypothetical protein